MLELLKQAELFEGLTTAEIRRLTAIGRRRTLRAGEYVFLLGDNADYLCVVVKGQVDLCFPMPLGNVVKDVSVESIGPGKTLGWSALVKPYRFTLSARATEPSEVIGFARLDLLRLFETEPHIGCTLFARISEIVGVRLSTFQALWGRELQRRLATGT
jgi:CRP-like cAMP-binding protein